MEVHISVLGIIIALCFTSAMGSLIWWMLHPPKPVSLIAAKVKVAVDAIKIILVPSIGTDYSERGIELACRLGEEQGATIRLVNVIEVPLSLPLGVPLNTQEEAAQHILEAGKGIVETHNMKVETYIERARHAAEKIAEMAIRDSIELIVMGISPKGGAENIIGRTTQMLLRKLPCEIIIDAKPLEAQT